MGESKKMDNRMEIVLKYVEQNAGFILDIDGKLNQEEQLQMMT